MGKPVKRRDALHATAFAVVGTKATVKAEYAQVGGVNRRATRLCARVLREFGLPQELPFGATNCFVRKRQEALKRGGR